MKMFSLTVVGLAVVLVQLCFASLRPRNQNTAEEIVALHKSLVEIQSTTKTGDPQTDERNVQDFIEKWFKKWGSSSNLDVTVERQEVTEGRDNLYIYSGSKRNCRVMLTAHTDTVPPHVGYKVVGDKIYGRGTNDDKGSVAGMMLAYRDLLGGTQVKDGDVCALFVVGEEIGGEGMAKVPDLKLKWEAVIFGEPTDSKLASGQIGGIVFNITALGKAVHSGFPEHGVNAIDRLYDVMSTLHTVSRNIPENPKYGKNSVTIAQIKGGVADNVVPGVAWVSGSFRLTVSPQEVVKAMASYLHELLCSDTPFNLDDEKDKKNPCSFIEIDYPLQEEPMDIDHDVPGFETFGARFGSDISLLPGNHKKYLFGPGSILSAHRPDEFVTKRELVASVESYKSIVLHCLGQG